MKGKNDYEKEAREIGAENVSGTSLKDLEHGKYTFLKKGNKEKLNREGDSKGAGYWTPVYLESEDGVLARISAKVLMQAKGLKFKSPIGGYRLASIDQACEDSLVVELTDVEHKEVKPRKGQSFDPYTRYTPVFDVVEMPEPQYGEGE